MKPVLAEGETAPATTEDAPMRSEADLRGILSNDSMTEDEKKVYLAEQKKAEDAAKLRDEDYQLAYAVDILKGLETIEPQPQQ